MYFVELKALYKGQWMEKFVEELEYRDDADQGRKKSK
jgi:hypothetical protein